MQSKRKRPIRRQNDILWKGILERVFDDLLRFVFPRAENIFDLERGCEFLEKELGVIHPRPGKKADTRFVDKLAKVYQRDGSEEWVLVHVEVQAADDKEFALRMFRYYARLFVRFECPLTAIAIFTGKDGKKLPGMYIRKYEGAEVMYKYNTLCILDYTDRSLAMNRNPFALVMLAAKKALLRGKDLDTVLMREKLAIARMLIKRGYSEEKTEGILSFLHNYVLFKKPESNRIFEEKIDRLTGKTNTMDIIEQVKQMKLEEARKVGGKEADQKRIRLVVTNLLTKTSHTAAKIAELVGVSEAYVNRVKASLAK